MPWRAVAKSGKPFHDCVTRSSATTLLRTSPCDMPPTTTSRPSVYATPKSLRRPGSSGRLVHVSAAGSYVSTVARSEVPLLPPRAYTSLPSDAAPSICRGVGMGAPSFHEVPSKISVVFSSSPPASTPPVTMMRSPTTAAAAAALGCSRGGSCRPATVDHPPHLVRRDLRVGAFGAPAAEHDRGVLPRHRHRMLHRNG